MLASDDTMRRIYKELLCSHVRLLWSEDFFDLDPAKLLWKSLPIPDIDLEKKPVCECRMETKSKSDAIRQISDAIDCGDDLSLTCILSKRQKILRIQLKIEDQESFVDENGVRWVRDS